MPAVGRLHVIVREAAKLLADHMKRLVAEAERAEVIRRAAGGQQFGKAQAQAQARAAAGGQGRDRGVAAERRDRTFVEAEIGGACALDLAQRDAAHHLLQIFGEAELEGQPLDLA